MKYQIKSDKGYYSRSMSTGKAIFLDSSEMGYTFTKEDAERMLDKLEMETGKDLEIVEYNSYYEDGGNINKYYTTSFPMYFSEFIDIEVEERENYDLEDIKDWKSKYNLKNDDLVLWITPKPYIAARYQMPSEDWDMAEQIYNDNPSNYGVEEVENGVIIEESDDGDDGYLMIIKKNKMAKGGQIYNFDVVLYNDDEDYTIKEKKRYQVKASNRSSAYDKAKTKYPKPYFVELYSVDNYADGGMMEDGGSVSDTIAMTILKQLGGINKLVAMTGAYNFVDLGNGVSFKIKNQKANYIKITLNSMDLYDLEVGRIRADTYKVVTTHKDVYFDQLKPLIEKATGMYLSLFANGGNVQEENDVFDSYVPPTPEERAAQQQKKAEMAKIAMMFLKDGGSIDDKLEKLQAEKDKLKDSLLDASMSGDRAKKNAIEKKLAPINDKINELLKEKYNWKKMEDGAEIPYDKLYELDIDKLDMYERMKYDDLINRGISKEDTINVLINDTDGDYSQLSPELNKYVKWYKTYYWRKGSRKSKFAYGGITEEMKAAKNILGQESWNRMSEDEKLNATKYLIRKGQIEGGREEYQYDNYPYAKGGRVRFQQNISNR